MRKISSIIIFLFIHFFAPASRSFGQEQVGPLRYNPALEHRYKSGHRIAAKTTTDTLSLPFFEDFTGYSPFPDSTKWADFEVFVNNTIGVSPISRGVATFDDLDARGIPYDSFSNVTFRYADSLTSLPIDISSDSAADSLYLSFFYQPQGNSYYPLAQDSLNLYLRNKYGDFVLVWSAPGAALQPFQQVMIPVADSLYFHNAFQFRFVNIAALYWSDAVWNIDYIRLDKNRSVADTAINDIGFTTNPSFYLNDYTAMPYRQFFANTTGEIATFFNDSLHSNYNTNLPISYGYSGVDLGSGSILHSSSVSFSSCPPYGTVQLSYPTYSTVVAPPSANGKVVFENTFFIQSVSPNDPPGNDTVVQDQVFDNYLAYDDGSAEKSYYLNLFPTLPGKIAIEYHLNRPDTLRGMAIYFGRQIPFSGYKSFSLLVYSAIKGINGAASDHILYQQDLYAPAYADSVNHFWMYSFDNPLILPSGTFYAGTLQPAASASDSLYIGLDVNRVGGNHAYYNVVGSWMPSLVSGALMMRPLLGQSLAYLQTSDVAEEQKSWRLMPNPATDAVQFEFGGTKDATYVLTDIRGHTFMKGAISPGNSINISGLASGMYFVNLSIEGVHSAPQKLIKL